MLVILNEKERFAWRGPTRRRMLAHLFKVGRPVFRRLITRGQRFSVRIDYQTSETDGRFAGGVATAVQIGGMVAGPMAELEARLAKMLVIEAADPGL